MFSSSSDTSMNESRLKQDIINAGGINPTHSYLGSSILIIDFLTIGDNPQNEFSSSVEMNENQLIKSCLIRLPHIDTSNKSVWDDLSESIAKVVELETDINPYPGLMKTERRMETFNYGEGVIIRPNDGYNSSGGDVLTPHVVFEAIESNNGTLSVPMSFQDLLKIIKGLNIMWDSSYSTLETVKSSEVM
ncbi:MAG: hypothetical protein J07AB43_02650 [Candidatus Nanosalina sp. J07AB43]|nr:MAG: hypothetical protein J07AB43_02650 [Candidatus Nanosalina sp. J07AB43]